MEEKKYKCKECNGSGYISREVEKMDISVYGARVSFPGNSNVKLCSKCNGEGELDWIENIRGKKKPKLYRYSFAPGIYTKGIYVRVKGG